MLLSLLPNVRFESASSARMQEALDLLFDLATISPDPDLFARSFTDTLLTVARNMQLDHSSNASIYHILHGVCDSVAPVMEPSLFSVDDLRFPVLSNSGARMHTSFGSASPLPLQLLDELSTAGVSMTPPDANDRAIFQRLHARAGPSR